MENKAIDALSQKKQVPIVEGDSWTHAASPWLASPAETFHPLHHSANRETQQPQNLQLSTISSPICVDFEGLNEEVLMDLMLREIVQSLLLDPTSRPPYELKGGCLMHHGRLVLPRSSLSIPMLLREFHSIP